VGCPNSEGIDRGGNALNPGSNCDMRVACPIWEESRRLPSSRNFSSSDGSHDSRPAIPRFARMHARTHARSELLQSPLSLLAVLARARARAREIVA